MTGPGLPAVPDASVLDPDAVVGLMQTDAVRGLSAPEAGRRLRIAGPNELLAATPVTTWRKVARQLQDPLVYLLFAAIAVSSTAWLVEGAMGWPIDAVVIAVIVAVNATLGYLQEAKAEHAVDALRRMSAPTATVVRDGVHLRVPTRELVPGDVLLLAEGDTVAADARLLSAAALRVTEASLTGESEPVLKDPRTLPAPVGPGDRLDMVFNGTAVAQGVGRAVVTATGMATELGQIAHLLDVTREAPTPLEREIARVGRMLGTAVIVIAVVVVATVLLAFGVESGDDVVTALLLGVSLAVAAVPEGLPAILSVVLALGVQRMAARNAIVTKLSSVETLGSASVICSDKTGTLTTGEMTLGRVITAAGEVTVTGAGYRPEGRLEQGGQPVDVTSALWQQAARVVEGGSLANHATLREEHGDWVVSGDPTEGAFLVAEAKLGRRDHRVARFRPVGELPFTSERKMMTSVAVDLRRGGRLTVVSKGAPDVLLGHCSHQDVGDRPERLDVTARAVILRDVERLSGEGFRTLGVARRELDATVVPELDGSVERDLVYTGTVAISDPARPEAADAVAEAHHAGVRVIMITGDHPRTAARIAADLGIGDDHAVAVSGAELDALDPAALRETVRHRSVYARVTPAHKLRIVGALQADHRVVAMTGDGVNDAPALKAADIGVAMGRTGTEVTKEAATMILADDNFATIVHAIGEGRRIFSNIKKFLRYLLSSNMGEVLTVFLGVVLAPVLGLATGNGTVLLPLLATQILWINLLTDSAPALAMGVDPETDDVMSRPPRSPDDGVIDRRMWLDVGVLGLVMAVATLATIDLYLPGGLLAGHASPATARTAGFTVLVLAQLFNALNARSETASAFRRMFANRWLWAAIATSTALQVAVVHVAFLGKAFSTAPLSPGQWLVCLAMASLVLWAGELRKLLTRRRGADRGVRRLTPGRWPGPRRVRRRPGPRPRQLRTSGPRC